MTIFNLVVSSKIRSLASGYPLHHLHRFAVRWFRYYPSRKKRIKINFLYIIIVYLQSIYSKLTLI